MCEPEKKYESTQIVVSRWPISSTKFSSCGRCCGATARPPLPPRPRATASFPSTRRRRRNCTATCPRAASTATRPPATPAPPPARPPPSRTWTTTPGPPSGCRTTPRRTATRQCQEQRLSTTFQSKINAFLFCLLQMQHFVLVRQEEAPLPPVRERLLLQLLRQVRAGAQRAALRAREELQAVLRQVPGGAAATATTTAAKGSKAVMHLSFFQRDRQMNL